MRTLVGLSGTPLNGPKPVTTKEQHGRDIRDESTTRDALLSEAVVVGFTFDGADIIYYYLRKRIDDMMLLWPF